MNQSTAEVSYGMTANGQMYECHRRSEHTTFIRCTPDPERYLRWIIQSAVDQSANDEYRPTLIKILEHEWAKREDGAIRGSFNTSLYLKVIEEKRRRDEL